MAKYRKKPVVIEAQQFYPDQTPWPDGVLQGTKRTCSDPQCGDSTWDHACDLGAPVPDWFYVQTREGPLRIRAGDWLITGVQGEQYPCKDEIFRETYESVN